MERYTITDGATAYTRISKREARKIFNADGVFYIIGHKMRPGMPFSLGMVIDSKHVKQERSRGGVRGRVWGLGAGRSCLTPTYPTLESLFDATVTDFCFYNANCHETGTYAAFYTMRERSTAKVL